MRRNEIIIDKTAFNEAMAFFYQLDVDYGYLYKEFEFTYQVFVEQNVSEHNEEIRFIVRSDHDSIVNEISNKFRSTPNFNIYHLDSPISEDNWKLVLGGSNTDFGDEDILF